MLKETIKSNPIIHPVARGIKKTIILTWARIGKKRRVKRNNNIEKYKGIHAGKKCFIVATGPSLTLDDLDLIKDQYTFSMNSIINLYEKTDFRPKYYLIQDGNVERRLHNRLIEVNHGVSFLGIGDISGFKPIINKKQAKPYTNLFEFYNLDIAYHIYDLCYADPKSITTNFSDDCAAGIFDGGTVTYSAIQLACYMGFKEIYLLGCDTNYSGHVDESGSKNKTRKSEPALVMINSYKVAKKYADFHGIKIINCTRGGMLEVFPRKTLEEVLEVKNENSSYCSNEAE